VRLCRPPRRAARISSSPFLTIVTPFKLSVMRSFNVILFLSSLYIFDPHISCPTPFLLPQLDFFIVARLAVFLPAIAVAMFFFAYLRGYNNFTGRSTLLHTEATGINSLRERGGLLIPILLTAGDLLEQFIFSIDKLSAI
jgi:hypothetical protein